MGLGRLLANSSVVFLDYLLFVVSLIEFAIFVFFWITSFVEASGLAALVSLCQMSLFRLSCRFLKYLNHFIQVVKFNEVSQVQYHLVLFIKQSWLYYE
jgi:hypothetical protein